MQNNILVYFLVGLVVSYIFLLLSTLNQGNIKFSFQIIFMILIILTWPVSVIMFLINIFFILISIIKGGKDGKEKSKEVATTKGTELFSVAEKEFLKIMDADAESYVDETSAEDIAIPRIVLLQSNSKPCKKSEAEYIKGAEEGDIFNTLSQVIVEGDVGILFVPVKRRIVYIHWRDIDAGGGLLENFGDDPTEYNKINPDDKGKRRTSAETEIVKTHETFGYVVHPSNNTFEEVLLSLFSTNEKKQRRFNALIRSLTGTTGKTLPEYAGVYKLTTVPESNDKNSWFTWNFESAGFTFGIPVIGKSMYEAAKKFARMVKKNDVKVKYEQDAAEEVDEETEVM